MSNLREEAITKAMDLMGEPRLHKCSVIWCNRYADSFIHPNYQQWDEVIPVCKYHHLPENPYRRSG